MKTWNVTKSLLENDLRICKIFLKRDAKTPEYQGFNVEIRYSITAWCTCLSRANQYEMWFISQLESLNLYSDIAS